MKYDFKQSSVKSLGISIDLLKLRGILTCSSPISFQDCIIIGNCRVGAFTYFGKKCELRNVTIGNYCSISAEVIINPFQHPTSYLSTSGFAFGDNGGLGKFEKFRKIKSNKPIDKQGNVKIGSDVWIGRRVIIMAGVVIGNGAIIAANSAVTKDVPAYSIYGGVPARLIKMRFEQELLGLLLKNDWFEYVLDKTILVDIDYSDIPRAVSLINSAKNRLEKINRNITINGITKEIIVKY